MIRSFWYVLVLVSFVVLSGCMPSGYSQFYNDYTKGSNQLSMLRFLQPGEEPEVMLGGNLETDGVAMQTEGYVLIGFSSFNGKYEDIENVKRQAKKVGATKALVYSQYSNTISGTMPITTYKPGQYVTTNHSGNFNYNTYGNYGYSSNTYGNYSGTSSTYIPGSTSTNYVPYNVQRYDQAASFWVKGAYRLGVRTADVPDEIKKERGSNKGSSLMIVVRDTPAYRADLFAGDVVTRVNNDTVESPQHLAELIGKNGRKDFVLTIYRDGEYLEKPVAYGK